MLVDTKFKNLAPLCNICEMRADFYALHIINYQCRQCGQQNASSEESLITHRLYNKGRRNWVGLVGLVGTNLFLLKYYSLTVVEGKTFILVFCDL